MEPKLLSAAKNKDLTTASTLICYIYPLKSHEIHTQTSLVSALFHPHRERTRPSTHTSPL
jgi:hypothetical protein